MEVLYLFYMDYTRVEFLKLYNKKKINFAVKLYIAIIILYSNYKLTIKFIICIK